MNTAQKEDLLNQASEALKKLETIYGGSAAAVSAIKARRYSNFDLKDETVEALSNDQATVISRNARYFQTEPGSEALNLKGGRDIEGPVGDVTVLIGDHVTADGVLDQLSALIRELEKNPKLLASGATDPVRPTIPDRPNGRPLFRIED